jgi:hypothetical protein
MKLRLLFQDKAKRDARYFELKAEGRKLLRRTTGPQQIHPQYVEDFTGWEKHDTGFGNTVYKMYFKNLCAVEEI